MVLSVFSSTPPSIDPERITLDEQYRRLCEPVAEKVLAASNLLSEVASLVAQYEIDESAVRWYKALKIISTDFPNEVPRTIPPLRLNINQIRNGVGPIPGSFYLIPSGSLTEFLNITDKLFLVEYKTEAPSDYQISFSSGVSKSWQNAG